MLKIYLIAKSLASFAEKCAWLKIVACDECNLLLYGSGCDTTHEYRSFLMSAFPVSPIQWHMWSIRLELKFMKMNYIRKMFQYTIHYVVFLFVGEDRLALVFLGPLLLCSTYDIFYRKFMSSIISLHAADTRRTQANKWTKERANFYSDTQNK